MERAETTYHRGQRKEKKAKQSKPKKKKKKGEGEGEGRRKSGEQSEKQLPQTFPFPFDSPLLSLRAGQRKGEEEKVRDKERRDLEAAIAAVKTTNKRFQWPTDNEKRVDRRTTLKPNNKKQSTVYRLLRREVE